MYRLPENKRGEMRKPLGQVVRSVNKDLLSEKIVTVGDKVTQTFLEQNITPALAIVDYKIERKEYKGKPFQAEKVFRVKNPAGEITRELWNAIATAYTNGEHTLIEVEGEEDLAALPAIYLAPACTTVVYGLPQKGMVVVNVGDKERKLVGKFLKEIEVYNGN